MRGVAACIAAALSIWRYATIYRMVETISIIEMTRLEPSNAACAPSQ
jgi:hypothetical protein